MLIHTDRFNSEPGDAVCGVVLDDGSERQAKPVEGSRSVVTRPVSNTLSQVPVLAPG
jgi:hypothetical protein